MAVIVDTIKTSFRNLFSIRLDHVGYETTLSAVLSSSILNDFSVEPDPHTITLFKNYGLGFVSGNNTLICYIRNTGAKAFLPVPDNNSIRLLIHVNSGFIKRTAVQAAGSKQVYQFTNLGRTGNGTDKYLTVNSGGVSDNDLLGVGAVIPSSKCFGVIDIYTKDVGNDYRLFDGSGDLLGGNYKISFGAK